MMDYDLAIIGAGWAGFNAARIGQKLGLKTVLIENSQIGGTCLNSGCIPTKTLIQSAKIFNLTKKAKNFGIDIAEPKIDFLSIQSRKEKVVQQLKQGMEFSLKGIEIKKAVAKILSADLIQAGAEEIKARSIIIATGSRPLELPVLKFDGKKVISSDDILQLKELPKSLLIVGGGVIGCEFAGLFSSFGAKVAIAEKMPQLLPGLDPEAAKKIEQVFKKKGIKVNTGVDASSFNLSEYDLVLVCVGRSANVQGLGLEEAGIVLENRRIKVDDYLRTSMPDIFAAGDCASRIMLAHYAAYQGVIAGQNAASPQNMQKCDNLSIPNCIFTDPEIACVGLTEIAAQENGFTPVVAKFDFQASAMARIMDSTDGFIKIIYDKNSEIILGSVIVGPLATELIAILTLAVTSQLKVSQIRRTIFSHPSLSESIHEAI